MRIEVCLVLLPSECRHANLWCHTASIVDIVISVTLDQKIKIVNQQIALYMLNIKLFTHLTIFKENGRHVKSIHGNIWRWCTDQLHHGWKKVNCGSKL